MTVRSPGQLFVRFAVCATIALTASAALPPKSFAQAGDAQRRRELAVGAVVVGTMSLGASTADLVQSNGGTLTLFRAESRLSVRPGAEIHIGAPLTSRWFAEATGTWTHGDVRTHVDSDIEGVAATTITTSLSRFSIEGSALFTLLGDDRRSLFIRGGGGWMRELAGGGTFSEDGVIGNAGAGIKYWTRARSAAGGRRYGLRVDGRVVLRAKQHALGADTLRIAPSASADLMVGF
jgi:hypothetical protein